MSVNKYVLLSAITTLYSTVQGQLQGGQPTGQTFLDNPLDLNQIPHVADGWNITGLPLGRQIAYSGSSCSGTQLYNVIAPSEGSSCITIPGSSTIGSFILECFSTCTYPQCVNHEENINSGFYTRYYSTSDCSGTEIQASAFPNGGIQCIPFTLNGQSYSASTDCSNGYPGGNGPKPNPIIVGQPTTEGMFAQTTTNQMTGESNVGKQIPSSSSTTTTQTQPPAALTQQSQPQSNQQTVTTTAAPIAAQQTHTNTQTEAPTQSASAIVYTIVTPATQPATSAPSSPPTPPPTQSTVVPTNAAYNTPYTGTAAVANVTAAYTSTTPYTIPSNNSTDVPYGAYVYNNSAVTPSYGNLYANGNASALACDGSPVCYVYDPLRLQLPWMSSNQAWPQCYDSSEYVCTETQFICPITAPHACGRACFNSSHYSCNVNTDNFFSSTLVQVFTTTHQQSTPTQSLNRLRKITQ